MTHDPMCFAADTSKQQYVCMCDLIARVVERERERAAERVAALGCGDDCPACVASVFDATTAARGGE